MTSTKDFAFAYTGSEIISPKRATRLSAGHDVFYSGSSPLVIPPETCVDVPTGVIIESIPKEGLISIHPKSGLFDKLNVKSRKYTAEEVINNKEKGGKTEIFLPLHNFSNSDIVFHRGEKMAQFICRRVHDKHPYRYHHMEAFSMKKNRLLVVFKQEETHFQVLVASHNIPRGSYGEISLDLTNTDRAAPDVLWLRGIIDADYKGDVQICSTEPLFDRDDVQGIYVGHLDIVSFADDIFIDGLVPKEERTGGFGSTGSY